MNRSSESGVRNPDVRACEHPRRSHDRCDLRWPFFQPKEVGLLYGLAGVSLGAPVFLPQKSLSLAIGTVQAEIPAAKTFQDAPTTPTF